MFQWQRAAQYLVKIEPHNVMKRKYFGKSPRTAENRDREDDMLTAREICLSKTK